MNRSKKAALNVVSQLVLQVVTAVCGFIVPKFVLESFGSEVNGLVASITNFLGVMALLENSFGSVAKTAFYKPLALGDNRAISGVYNATESFFRKIALIFALYCIVLSVGFPFINENSFDFWFTASLVLILGITSFMQYYFGMSYGLALNADQLSFISAFLHVAAIIFNAVLTLVLLKLGAGIHVVKLVSAFVFIIKPIVINMYGRYRYKVDRKVPKDNESLAQKWDNMAQGVAMYVHTKTAYLFTTVFLAFKDVSVYSVYSLVTTSLTSLVTSLSTGFVAGLGNMYAKGEKENFYKVFSLYEFINTLISVLMFTVAAVMIMPFIGVYTANLSDAEYYKRPIFAMILIAAELIYCLRLPYYYMVANAGHFRQTKKGAWLEAGLNIIVSLCLLPFFGITGLAVALAVAMTVRTIEIMIYCCKKITKLSLFTVVKRLAVNLVSAGISMAICFSIPFKVTGFLTWFILAGIVGVVTLVIMGTVNFVIYKEDFKFMLQKLKSVLKK